MAARCSRRDCSPPTRSRRRWRRSAASARLCDRMEVGQVLAIATAACRDAKNGKAFVAEAERICGVKIDVLSGKREAELSALGVVSRLPQAGRHRRRSRRRLARTHRGAWAPHQGRRDASARRPRACRTSRRNRSRRRRRSSRRRSIRRTCCSKGKGRSFYAIGGTWRALARLHMWQHGYPLHVMQGYVIPAKEALRVFQPGAPRRSRNAVADRGCHRRPPPAAVLRGAGAGKPGADRASRRRWSSPRSACARVCSIRMLSAKEREKDPLIAAASELNVLRSRSPAHGEELMAWTDRFMASSGLDETADERRLRHAACLLGRYRLARASRLSRRAVAQHHCQCGLCGGRSSRPHLHLARGVLPPCRIG